MYYIGIDLGGTKIAAGILDMNAQKLIASQSVPTDGQDGPEAVLMRIANLCRLLCAKASLRIEDIAGVGLGVPAACNMETGVVVMLPNLPGDWDGRPAAPQLQEMIKRPVRLINDARAFTLAEATLGAGKGAPTVACFTLGTGIGGGLAINGQLYLGIDGAAAEFGHHTIDMYGPPDGSGNAGGFEGFASGPAIAAMGIKAVAQGITTQIGEIVNYDLNQITPRTIMQAAERGDAVAQEILERAGFYLGTGIANVITILAPHRIILGGGVAQLGDWIMQPIWKTIRQRCHTVPLDKLEILPAALGNDAGIIGAAIWASQG